MIRSVLGIIAAVVTFFALPPVFAAARSLEDPPPGIQTTSATLSDVLQHYDASEGPTRFHTRVEEWRVSERGLTGFFVETTSGADYRAVLTLGPFVTMSGRWHGQAWHQDENGLTVLSADIHQKTAISENAIEYAFDHPQAPGHGIELEGEVAGPVRSYVVRVHPDGGRLVWLFFDETTGLIDREEDVVAERRSVTVYDDYRPVDGEMHAWHHTISDGHPNNDEDWTLVSLHNDVSVDLSSLAIPPDRRALVEFPQGEQQVRLPARVINGYVIVRVTIDGHGLDFLLDSGAGDIALDSALAPVLHLQPIGKTTQEIAGQFDRSSAIVPEIDVGDLRMHNVVVSMIPYQLKLFSDVKVVGLLGFDFLKNAAIRIDYKSGTVDAFDPGRFVAPDAALSMPVALDDGVPLVPASVGQARGEHFILDTGSSFTVIFSNFATANPDAVADQGGGMAVRSEQATMAQGVGGQILLVPTELRAFSFGGVKFDYFDAYVTRAARGLESEDEDGLIGSPVLQRFIVYLDYQRQRVDLVRAP